jgi:murein DD-endopeptidase MepM/ murein hydrolase activator NlpD
MQVQKGDIVKRGQQICKVGNGFGAFVFHLHYDISQSGILETYAGDWPGTRRDYLFENYTDPLAFTRANRPRKVEPVIVKRIVHSGVWAHVLPDPNSDVNRLFKDGEEISIDEASATLHPATRVTMVECPTGYWIPAYLVDLPEITPPPPPPVGEHDAFVNTPGDVLLLRGAGNAAGVIVGKLPHRTKVTRTGDVNANGYIPVSVVLNGTTLTGWVKNSFLSLTIPN